MTIQRSEQLGDLLCALSKLQGRIENAKKDKSGYKNNYKYADLNQYIELSKELLAEYGLSVLQIPGSMEIIEITKEVKETEVIEITKEVKETEVIEITEKVLNKETQLYEYHQLKVPKDVIKFHKIQIPQEVTKLRRISIPKQKITTWIGHESGQFISESMEILVEKMAGSSWGQSTGSAISFARRYSRSGTLGMSQEDDDNMLSKKENERSSSKIDKERVDYLKELLKDDQKRLEKILLWASDQQQQKVRSIEDMSIEVYTATINILNKEKIKNEEIGKNRISPEQIDFIKKVVTTDRLNKILTDYNLNKLEDMSVEDYNNEYDKLRLENNSKENFVGELKAS